VSDRAAAHTSWTPDGETAPRPTESALIDAIATVYDPEIPVNIYELAWSTRSTSTTTGA